jgi:hypothetical protein
MNNTYLNTKFSQMLISGDSSRVNKVIETIIREDCIVDRVFPPQIVDISTMPSDPTNPMKKYVLVRYNANLGPAYTLGIGEAPIEHTTNNGFAPAYFFKIEYFFTKKEEEIRLFENNILDEVIIAIKERIGDQKDKIFFANGIANIIRNRDVNTVGPKKTQFINARYFQVVKGVVGNVIIEDSTVPQSFEDGSGNYHVGIKELIKTVKDKISELRISPGLFLLPWRFWNGLSTWDFGGAGVVTFDIFIQSAERVIGGQMLTGINVQTTSKYIDYISGIPGEVQGPININVLGAVKKNDYNTAETDQIDENASLGYLLPSDEFFGVNYVHGPVTDIKSDIFEKLPMIRLYTYYYTALAIGNSRSYIAFPAR